MKISVSVYSQQHPQSMILKPKSDHFRVFGGGMLLVDLKQDELLFITASSGRVRVRTIDRALGTFTRILVKPISDTSEFTLSPTNPAPKVPRSYCGSVGFTAKGMGVESIVEMDFETYIAGVVEAEIGPRQLLEMYKVQAVIARTFALGHLTKHKAEKFNLCDDVHCQAFKGLSKANPDIIAGCEQTRDLVVVTEGNELITAVFHANCGGQTVNSEDVWPKYKSYLRSCPCSYCSKSRNYKWRMGVPLNKWDKYLGDNGVSVPPERLPHDFKQPSRRPNVEVGNVTFPLFKIRRDLGLRSTFFNFSQIGDSIVFSGRGYGHGVGLCQDGASQMARMRMTYQQIISYYYRGCRIVNRQNAVPEGSGDGPIGATGSREIAASVAEVLESIKAKDDSSDSL